MSIDNASPNDWYVTYRNYNSYLKDKQVGGDHYKSDIQSWDVFLDWGLDPWACNVIKYIQRHRKKAGKQDLEKAKHYLEFMLENYDTIGAKYYKD